MALAELARQTSELQAVDCRFECDDTIEVRDQFVATHLYRIAQEAITNVLKHAGAKHIWVSLEKQQGLLALKVIDDGLGIRRHRRTARELG